MNKKLPIRVPIVKAYKWHAVPLSIFCGHAPNLNWIYNNYLQLVIQDYPDNPHWLDFFSIYDLHNVPRFPWLNTQSITLDLFLNEKSQLIDFIINCINKNYYLDVCYDMYHVNYSFAYQQNHRISNLLVHGYNFEEKVFYIMDYLYASRKGYQCFFINMDTLANAILSKYNYRGIKGIYEYDRDFTFGVDNVLSIMLIKDYVNSQNSFHFFDRTQKKYPTTYKDMAFGWSIYQYLISYIETLIKNSSGINILPFTVLSEHKQCLYGYINLFDKTKTYTVEMKEIAGLAEIIKYKCIKYSITHDIKILKEIKLQLISLCENEQWLLNAVLKEFE